MSEEKNIFILGDSYSTFEGYIPDGYAAYYTNAGHEKTDVNKVEQTWWYRLKNENKLNLVRNCSWSGTTICHTGYNGADRIDNSFVSRFDKLIDDGFFDENKIDTMFLFGGTNDSWADSPVGELMYADWTTKDLYSVLPAICYLLNRVCKTLPQTKVICIINTELKPEISDGMKSACQKYGVEIAELHDIDKANGHPTILGMTQMKDQIAKML